MIAWAIDENIAKLDASELHRRTPFIICGVRNTQFSLARHYGGIDFNGDSYTYFAESDELVRADVLKFLRGEKVKKTMREKTEARAATPDWIGFA